MFSFTTQSKVHSSVKAGCVPQGLILGPLLFTSTSASLCYHSSHSYLSKKSLQFPVVARLFSSGHTQKQLCTLLLIKVYSLFFGCVKQIKQEEETHCYSRRLPGDGKSTLRAAYSRAFIYSCLLCLCLSCLPVPI